MPLTLSFFDLFQSRGMIQAMLLREAQQEHVDRQKSSFKLSNAWSGVLRDRAVLNQSGLEGSDLVLSVTEGSFNFPLPVGWEETQDENGR